MKIIYTPRGKAHEYAQSREQPDQQALAVNLYGGCAHGCKYCYVPNILHISREEFHREVVPVKNGISRFEADCKTLQVQGNKSPIFMSFTCDPCPKIEKELDITKQAIEIAHHYKQTVNILTKGDAIETGVLNLMKPGDIFGVTLTCYDEKDRQLWEPHAISLDERLNCLTHAHNLGLETRVSFEPVLFPTDVMELIHRIRTITSLIQVGKLNPKPGMPREIFERERVIDWTVFAHQVRDLLDELGGEYYLKNDLRRFM